MQETKKRKRFTEKHGAYYWTPTVDGKTKWVKLSRDLTEAVLLYEEYEHGPVDRKVSQILELLVNSKRWQQYAPHTQKTYRSLMDKINAYMGHKPIESIDGLVLTRFIHAHGYQGNLGVSVLSSAYKQAILEGWTNTNPCSKGNHVKAATPRRIKHVQYKDIQRLRENVPDERLGLAMDLAIMTALRKSDLIMLSQDNVTERGLVVAINKTRTNGRVLEFQWTPALRKACQYLPIGYTENALDSAWRRLKMAQGVDNLQWHDLRRFALQEARRVRNGQAAQELADHRDYGMTELYLAGAPKPVTPLDLPEVEEGYPAQVVAINDYR